MPHIFISYSRKDIRYAFKLAGALEVKGWEVWIDEENKPSQEFGENIKRAIKGCGAMLVLMSPASRNSEWVGREVRVALENGKKIFPLLLGGKIFETLSDLTIEDVSQGSLPSLDFFGELGNLVPPGKSYVRVLVGDERVAPGEYAVDDPSLPERAKSLVETGRAVWIDIRREVGRKGLRIIDTSELPSGLVLHPSTVYAHDDVRLHGLTKFLLDKDYAASEKGVAVPDGPLPLRAERFTLPMLEWCQVTAGAKRTGGVDTSAQTFLIGKFPVTNEQFQAFLDPPDGYADEHWWNFSEHARDYRALHPQPPPLVFEGPKRPRVTVCWYDAVAFCRWLSWKTGLSIFLPTTAQWLRAAQGDEPRQYPWGNEPDVSRCNTRESGILETTNVDRYPSGLSPCGACDMSGNVWEWTFTKYGSDDATDARGNDERREHGGSWRFELTEARISMLTAKSPPGRYDNNIGFRLACYPSR
jgi:formylglycine-generating enzyme required for sulfatase activity